MALKHGSWLTYDSEDVEILENGEVSASIDELIQDELELPSELEMGDFVRGLPPLTSDQLHVLVVFPANDRLYLGPSVRSGPRGLRAWCIMLLNVPVDAQ